MDAALELLDAAAPAIAELPRRLVHGDVAPDNVVHDLATDEVVAVIDFTPFHEPSLFGLCTALYWYHVHPEWADVSGVDASLAAWTAHRPLLRGRARPRVAPARTRGIAPARYPVRGRRGVAHTRTAGGDPAPL